MNYQTLSWQKPELILLDQTKLPNDVVFVKIRSVHDIYHAIKDMIVRGAPAIGVTAAYGAVIAALHAEAKDLDAVKQEILRDIEYIEGARPTAVNLAWAAERMRRLILAFKGGSISELCELLEKEALQIHQEDLAINKKIGENLLSLLPDNATVLTHCNAGALATSGYGTALSVFYLAKEQGKMLHAYADETRPRQQGARLTAFELYHAGIDVTLITDNMAALVMSQGKIDAVIVGCDRIAANGDTANKIGTLGVAVLAKHFNVPFYIAAPTPTIDMNIKSGADIPIEERSGEEITKINGAYVAPAGVKTYNPGFDVTPAALLTAIVTEKGICRAPYTESLRTLFS